MSDRSLRRSILGVTVGGALLVGALSVLFWRVLPSPVPAHAGRVFTDARPYKGTPILPSSLPTPTARGVRAALIVEPENVRVNPEGAYEGAVRHWRTTLLSLGVTIVAPGDADVLVLPQAVCLGPVQRRIVQAHLARGGGIITTGAVGAYDGVCTPLRDTLVASLLGIGHGAIRPAPRRVNDAHYAVLLGESVLGAHMPPGARIEFRPAGQIVFLSNTREMLYSDFLRSPMNAGRPFFDAAALRATVGPGRVVAFGFSPADLVGDWSTDIGRIVVSNAVRWAAGHTMFQLAPWPEGKKAAAVMAIDVEADYQNARDALDALASYKLPGTAFIVGSLAERDPETTRRLIGAMEIGTHTQRHLPLDTLTDVGQAQELANSKRIAERLADRPVPGFRPPEERFTPATLQIWADLGGRYVFASNNGRAAGPEILPLLPDSLILLGRVSEDDYEILDRSSIRDRAQMSHLLLSQVGESIAYRGLYMFSYHSHMMSQKEAHAGSLDRDGGAGGRMVAGARGRGDHERGGRPQRDAGEPRRARVHGRPRGDRRTDRRAPVRRRADARPRGGDPHGRGGQGHLGADATAPGQSAARPPRLAGRSASPGGALKDGGVLADPVEVVARLLVQVLRPLAAVALHQVGDVGMPLVVAHRDERQEIGLRERSPARQVLARHGAVHARPAVLRPHVCQHP
jgi:peptidoglycan/xylan/chitin deacetylase (PgdA/CDA1 family)